MVSNATDLNDHLGRQLYGVSRDGSVEEVKRLLEEGAPVNWKRVNKWTAIHVACTHNRVDIVKLLLEYNADVNKQENSGHTALHMACLNGHINCVKLLMATGQCDLDLVTISGYTVLGLAVRKGKLKIIKCLVIEYSVDVNAPITTSGDTALGLAVSEGKLDVIKCLFTECRANVNDNLLFLALKEKRVEILQYILADCYCDPNIKNDDRQTPLTLAMDKDSIKLLLMHGATAEDAYSYHRKALGNVFSIDRLKNPVKMFIIGDGGEGKSTLIEAMEHEPTALTSLANIFGSPREVDGVSQKTAGIIPRLFKSRVYGDVLVHDFAGQEAYYSSHAAIIKSTINTCPPILVLVISLLSDDITTAHSVSYWLGIIANQCANMESKAPLIVVGSHADLATNVADISRKKDIIFQAVRIFSMFDLIDIIPMDCRFSNSSGMRTLRRHVGASCQLIRSKLSVSLNSHMLLIYLLDKYFGEVAITLKKLMSDISHHSKMSKRQKTTLSFIPTTIPHLVNICVQLSDKGHILFLHNTSSPDKSFIVISRTELLCRINGTIFAPEDFHQHCELASSTGVVALSKLAAYFPDLNPDMVVGFLSHFEFAVPIEDPEILSLINPFYTLTHVRFQEAYLFCPALVRLQSIHRVFEYQIDFSYHFCWILSCVESDDFFDARFLHVLIIRLALSSGHARELYAELPSIQRQCSVWTTGVCWTTPWGAKVLVEVVAKKNVCVLVQAYKCSNNLLELQSSVIQKVLKAAAKLCPSIATNISLLRSADVTYPVNMSYVDTISLKSIAKAVVTQAPVAEIVQVEVYSGIGENVHQLLFNSDDPTLNQKISDRFLSALSSSWSKNPKTVDIIYSAISKETDTRFSSVDTLETVLKHWRDSTNATYKSLRQMLDGMSIFAGFSPLELAGVPPRMYSEELLPEIWTECTVTQAFNPGPITIVKHPDDKHIKPGYRVEFTIKMLSPPEKYQWYFQEKAISTEDDDYSGSTTYRLQIKRCFSKHTGSYRCGLINIFGQETKSSTAILTIDGEIIGSEEVNLLYKVLRSSGIQSLNGKGDLTYEEVLLLLYNQLPLHINLKKILKSRVEEEHLYQEAIMNGQTVSLRYLKLLLLGPGQVGKSTFLRRLLGKMKWDIDTDPKPHCSTGMAHSQQVCIEYTHIAAAVTTDGNWHSFEELHNQVDVLTSMLVLEQVHSKKVSISKCTGSQSRNEPEIPEAVSHLPQLPCDSDLSALPTSTQEHLGATTSPDNLKSSKSDDVLQQDTLSPNIANVLDKFEELRLNLRLNPKQISTDTLLNIVDVGGQPAFLDMLPSLTIGPAMYLVFMKLIDGLRTEHPVEITPDVDTDPIVCKEYTYTSEDIIFTTLSSIACFGNSDAEVEKYIASDNKPNEVSNSVTLLFGTFKDKYFEETKETQLKVDQDETDLKTRLKDTGLHNIEYYDREKGQIFFRVDNKYGGKKEIVIYRKRLEELIANRFRKYKIPARWLMLSICLKLLAIEEGGHFVSLKHCLEIGEQFEMTPKQVKTALKFLHRYIGLVMYFPDNENLRDIVICDPQVIFSSISEIIFDVYAPTNSKFTVCKYERFTRSGRFSLKDIETKREDLLPVKSLVELLVHVNIAAPIPSSKEYFLPAVLRSIRVQPSTVFVPNEPNLPNLEPIFIRFQTGFVPLGFVCAFMANLIARVEFNLLGEDVYKNHIEVSFKEMFKITLISCPRYCKFYVSQLPNAYLDKTVDFLTIRKKLCKVADDVINALQHGSVYKLTIKPYELAFRCPNPHKKTPNEMIFGNEQLASVIFDDYKRFIKCSNLKCQVKMELTPAMDAWFYKTLQIIEQPNLNTRNETTTISMSAEGAEPLSYQWLLNGTMISDDKGYQGSNSSILTISKIESCYRGYYSCEVRDCDDQFLFSDEAYYDVRIVVQNKLKREGLPDDDIITLKGEGFTTLEGFRELNQSIVNSLNLSKGGKILLTKLISKHGTVENSGSTTVQASANTEQPSSGSILTLDDLSSVYEKLIKAAENWFDLGLALKVSPGTLHNIRDRYQGNKAGLREMLTARLETATLTYSELCQSLRAQTIKQYVLAEAIEKECTDNDTVRQKLSTTILDQP